MTILQQKIIDLRQQGFTYQGIQLQLGNPSKKFIKQTLKQFAPHLINIDCNYNKLKNDMG